MIDYSLYLCTNSEINSDYPIECCVDQAIWGGVTIVQIREKGKNYNEFFQIASRIKKVTDKYDIPLIINDISCLEARKILGSEKIIGVTVTNVSEAKQAVESGATYLGVGAIYKSTTKKDAIVVGIDELKKIVEYSSIPVVVIGGINENTIPMLKNIKIDGYAMIRPILAQKNITASAKKLKLLINNNKSRKC